MKRILIAEDNDSNYMLMTYILKSQYGIFRAFNGVEAVEKAKTEKPDMVLMDIKMPIMDGLQATRLIRAEMPDCPSSPLRPMPSTTTVSRLWTPVATTSSPSPSMRRSAWS